MLSSGGGWAAPNMMATFIFFSFFILALLFGIDMEMLWNKKECIEIQSQSMSGADLGLFVWDKLYCLKLLSSQLIF